MTETISKNVAMYIDSIKDDCFKSTKQVSREIKVSEGYVSQLRKYIFKNGLVTGAKLIIPYRVRMMLAKDYGMEFESDSTVITIIFEDGVNKREARQFYDELFKNIPLVSDVKWLEGDFDCSIELGTFMKEKAELFVDKLQKLPFPICYYGISVEC